MARVPYPSVTHAVAIDEGEEINFEFEGLPDWMEIVDRDFISDSVTVAGEVPENQDDFSFLLTATDEDDMQDTLSVFVGIDSLHILHGFISGVLRREDSPFLINDTAIVAADDSLIIEPGCRIIFQRQRDGETSRLLIYGSLYAEGTEEDSIYITRKDDWRNGRTMIYGSEGNEVVIRYCYLDNWLANEGMNMVLENSNLQGAVWGINVYPENIEIRRCLSENSRLTIGGSGIISESVFNNTRMSIGGLRWEILDNEFRDSEGTGISLHYANFASIQDNLIERCGTGIGVGGIPTVDDYSLMVSNNIIIDCSWGIQIGVDACYTVTNNQIVNSVERAIRVSYSNSILINNVIFNSPIGIYYATEYGSDYNINLINNLFMEVDTLISRSQDPMRDDQYFAYNCFYNIDEFGNDFGYLGELDTINANGDSTDSNFNQYIDPSVFDIDELDFHLFQGSRLINAGHPDSIYYDIDGSINDIGLYGGPHGEEYEYPEGVNIEDLIQVNDFALFNPYPNPFNSTTMITYNLPLASQVSLKLYDLTGRRIATLFKGHQKTGIYTATLTANDLPSGIYFVRLEASDQVLTQKVMLIR